jgi:hypothetical protein
LPFLGLAILAKVPKTFIILGEGRKVLSPPNFPIDAAAAFKMFSVSLVRELLLKGQDEMTRVEKRKDVLSITNGAYTLELSVACPPFCN